jgi:hypothetical protein
MVLASCALNTVREVRSEPEIIRVGEVEVRLYSDREAMVRNLPPLFALLEATKVGNTRIQVSGYYDKENKRIYSINDAKTVIHEFKHYLEPEWKHATESAHTNKVQTPPDTKSPPPLMTQIGVRETTGEVRSDF